MEEEEEEEEEADAVNRYTDIVYDMADTPKGWDIEDRSWDIESKAPPFGSIGCCQTT